MAMVMGSKMKKVFHITFALLIIAIIATILGCEFLPTEGRIVDGKASVFEAEWYQIMDDGSRLPVSVPGFVTNKPGEWTSLVCTIPQLEDSRHSLLLRSSQQDVYVYIDGKPRKSYSTEETRFVGKSTMSANVFVPLDKEDSGKELIVSLKSVTSYSGYYNTIYYGTEGQLYGYLVNKNMAGLLLAYTLLTSGIVTFIIGFFLRIKYKASFPMIYAALEAIIVSFQAILESRLRQFYLPNVSTAGFMSYFMIGLIPIVTMLYINVIQKARYEKVYFPMTIACLINGVLNVVLQLMNVEDMYGSLWRSYLLYAISFVVITYAFYQDYKKGILRDIKYPFVGVMLTYIMAFAEIVITILKLITVTGVFVNIGMSALLIAAIVESLKQVDEINKEKHKAISDNIAKQNFLANMSHEIRTPINAILGMNEMILRECDEAEIRQYSANIRAAGDNLLDIINDILDFSKIELGKLEIYDNEYCLSSLLRDVNNIISIRAESKELRFEIKVDENIPEKLIGDEYRMRQILLNLLNNAVKYTEKGKISLHVYSRGNIDKNRISLQIDVEDTGIGIKAEDLDKIFNSFERIDLQHNKNIEGTGLGLAITHTIVDMMQGEISVDSCYGKGSKFMVTIPQGKASDELFDYEAFEEGSARATKEKYRESFHSPEAKVLVVDDYPINITVIKGLLKKTQLQIAEATSGKECLEKCEKERFNLILMDHMMPDMDGVETFYKLKEAHENLCPVIILTANAIEGAKEQYLKQGFADYISKPVNPVELERVIKEYIIKRK